MIDVNYDLWQRLLYLINLLCLLINHLINKLIAYLLITLIYYILFRLLISDLFWYLIGRKLINIIMLISISMYGN